MIIIEGLDGVGKTTLVDYLVNQGMKKYHFDYDAKNMDLYSKYLTVLKDENPNIVLDRSFISEMVYGPVLRNNCKLELEQYKKLLLLYKQRGASLIYLTAPKYILLERRKNEEPDYEMILNHYDKLHNQYNDIIDYSENFIDVFKFDTHEMGKQDIMDAARKIILK